jgi:2,4-dienoyl-CoA reductase-like NADH-dependent reductase (Old Yellow Enzyme family)
MYVMRGEMPIYSMTYYMKQLWLKYGVRMVGRYMIPTVPFKELYFLDDARLFRKELKLPLVYVGGAVSREGIDRVLDDEGFEFVQMGRALLNDPAFVNHLKQGAERCGCDHINYCIARMYSREMACHKHLDNLPPKILKEIDEIKARDERRK